VVGDFFQQILATRLIDGGAEFPFARPYDSIWEPFFDAAKEWLGGIFRDWLLKERAKPPRRDFQGEVPRSEPTQREKDRLQDMPERLREQRELDGNGRRSD
jgi:hypothetical protein